MSEVQLPRALVEAAGRRPTADGSGSWVFLASSPASPGAGGSPPEPSFNRAVRPPGSLRPMLPASAPSSSRWPGATPRRSTKPKVCGLGPTVRRSPPSIRCRRPPDQRAPGRTLRARHSSHGATRTQPRRRRRAGRSARRIRSVPGTGPACRKHDRSTAIRSPSLFGARQTDRSTPAQGRAPTLSYGSDALGRPRRCVGSCCVPVPLQERWSQAARSGAISDETRSS